MKSQHFQPVAWEKLIRKYDAMPDVYYLNSIGVGPVLFGNRHRMEELGFQPGSISQIGNGWPDRLRYLQRPEHDVSATCLLSTIGGDFTLPESRIK